MRSITFKEPGPRTRLFPFLFLLVLSLAAVSPGWADDPAAGVGAGKTMLRFEELPPFDGVSSIEELARLVFKAYREEDFVTLASYLITKQEYRAHVWEGSEAQKVARPDGVYDFDFLWSRHLTHQNNAIPFHMGKYKHKDLEVLKAEVGAKVWPYKGARGLMDVAIIVRDRATGEEFRVRPFGTVFEREDGIYKVRSYLIKD